MNMEGFSYIYVDSDEKLESVMNYLSNSRVIGIDTETTGLDPHTDRIRLLQISDMVNPVAVIDLSGISISGSERIGHLLQNDAVKVFQNAKFDIKFLTAYGYMINGPIFDTMLAAQIASGKDGPISFGLEVLADFYLGVRLSKAEQRSNWSGELSMEQIEYAAKDAYIILYLRERLIKEIKKAKLIEVCKLEFECALAVADMELSGVKLDLDKWRILQDRYQRDQKEFAKKLIRSLSDGNVQMNIFGEEKELDINLDSHVQVIKALKSRGIDLKSTSHYELIEYRDEYPIINWLLEYRRLTKAIQSFLYPLPQSINPVTGRIHSNYRQIGAHSGRFSCSNPNLQQVPRGKDFRECFIPEDGNKLVIADYSQIELRVAAEIAQDKTMITAYRDGQDLHALTAALIANKKIADVTKAERQAAKAVNFGLIYSMGAKGLQGYAKATYGINMTLEEAETFRERFFNAYEGIANWHADMRRRRNNSESRTLSGRRCVYHTEPGVTALLNTPVQGTAADITKKALGMLMPVVRQIKGHIIATVHDEIILEVGEDMAEEAAKELKNIMEMAGKAYLKTVPVVAETSIGDSWAEK